MKRRVMTHCKKMGMILALACVLPAGHVSAQSCTGRFVNPVTDVCWECLFPISIGPIRMGNAAGAPDTPNPGSPICYCGNPIPRIGLSLGDVGAGAADRRQPRALVFPEPRGHDHRRGAPPPGAGERAHRAATARRVPPGTPTTTSTLCSRGSGRCSTWAASKEAGSTSPGSRSSTPPGGMMNYRSC